MKKPSIYLSIFFTLVFGISLLTSCGDDTMIEEEEVEEECQILIPIQITCPADITITGRITVCDTLVSIPNLTINDSTQVQSITNDFTDNGANASGLYPCGLTRVTYSVMDECGGIETCSFDVNVIPPEINYDSIVSIINFPAININGIDIDMNNDGDPDLKVRMKVFTGEIGYAEADLTPLSNEWFIATLEMSDTITIDTNYLSSDSLIYNTSHYYYNYKTDDTWHEIKSYAVPNILYQYNVDCTSLQYSNQELLVWRDPFFTLPFNIPFHNYNYINPGIRSFNGYLIMKNGDQCFSIRAIFEDSKLMFGTPRLI